MKNSIYEHFHDEISKFSILIITIRNTKLLTTKPHKGHFNIVPQNFKCCFKSGSYEKDYMFIYTIYFITIIMRTYK